MTSTSRKIWNELNSLLDYLARSAVAETIAQPVRDGTRITWQPSGIGGGDLYRHPAPTVDEYISWLRARAYSALLFDGSLLQVTYNFDGDELVGHRLAYVPCPFLIDAELARTMPLQELIELYLDDPAESVVLRATIRFDYDPGAARADHPASHVSINSPGCRIPCVAPLHLSQFTAFVFRHFYPQLRGLHPILFSVASDYGVIRTIVEDEEGFPHIAWRRN
jgi:hypothetical protein